MAFRETVMLMEPCPTGKSRQGRAHFPLSSGYLHIQWSLSFTQILRKEKRGQILPCDNQAQQMENKPSQDCENCTVPTPVGGHHSRERRSSSSQDPP